MGLKALWSRFRAVVSGGRLRVNKEVICEAGIGRRGVKLTFVRL